MKERDSRFGINMTRYVAAHEASVRERLARPEQTADEFDEILQEHLLKIAWLQHERLIHLLVTITVALLLMFLFALQLVIYSIPLLALLCLSAVLLAAYILHYFRLENSVQYWYRLADEIRKKKGAMQNPDKK